MLKVLMVAGVLVGALSLLFVMAGGSSDPASATVPQTCNGQPLTHPAFLFFGVGSSTDDSLAGVVGFGSQVILGLQGQDCIAGEDGNDLLIGGNDDDELYGGVGNDILVGGQGNDQLFGGDGDDVLIGASALSADSDLDTADGEGGADLCILVDFPFGAGGPFIENYTGGC